MEKLSRKKLAQELRRTVKEDNYFFLKRYATQAADELEQETKERVIIKDRPRKFLLLCILAGATLGVVISILASHTVFSPDYKCFGGSETYTCQHK